MLNPYQSPESPATTVKAPAVPLLVCILTFMLRIVLLSGAIGALMGGAFCFILSGGNADGDHYETYGLTCGIVGLVGGLLAGLILGFIRYMTRD